MEKVLSLLSKGPKINSNYNQTATLQHPSEIVMTLTEQRDRIAKFDATSWIILDIHATRSHLVLLPWNFTPWPRLPNFGS